MKLTKSEALAMMEKINQYRNKNSNIDDYKTTFVEIDDCNYYLFSYIEMGKNVIKRVAKLVPMGRGIENRSMLNLREARKVLS